MTNVGTTQYKAPEVILNQGHDFAVDWWSYGICIYTMLVGGFPFFGKNREKVIVK